MTVFYAHNPAVHFIFNDSLLCFLTSVWSFRVEYGHFKVKCVVVAFLFLCFLLVLHKICHNYNHTMLNCLEVELTQ